MKFKKGDIIKPSSTGYFRGLDTLTAVVLRIKDNKFWVRWSDDEEYNIPWEYDVEDAFELTETSRVSKILEKYGE